MAVWAWLRGSSVGWLGAGVAAGRCGGSAECAMECCSGTAKDSSERHPSAVSGHKKFLIEQKKILYLHSRLTKRGMTGEVGEWLKPPVC